MSLNRCILMGRLVRDPELRHTQTGVPVATFRLAVDRDFKDKTTGERATDWIDVVAWRGTGEFVSRYFSKGRMAVVEGRLQMREWTDRDGNKRVSAEVVADNVYFGDSKKDAEPGCNSAEPAEPRRDQFSECGPEEEKFETTKQRREAKKEYNNKAPISGPDTLLH